MATKRKPSKRGLGMRLQLYEILLSYCVAPSLRTVLQSCQVLFRGSAYCHLACEANRLKRLQWAQVTSCPGLPRAPRFYLAILLHDCEINSGLGARPGTKAHHRMTS